MAQPKCPMCGSTKADKGKDGTYRCTRCDAWFDDNPDEGSDFSDRNPAARMEREERQKERRK